MLDEATAAIRYNADLLRRTLDHMGLGLAVFDADGKLEVWNDRFAVLERPGAGSRSRSASTSRPCRRISRRSAAVLGHRPGGDART